MLQSFTVNKNLLVAGIDQFEYIPAADVQPLPNIRDLQISEFNIIVKPGKAWLKGFAVENSLEYEESPQISQQGLSYERALTGTLPHDAALMAHTFHSYSFTPLIVKYTDREGVRRLIGTPAQPVFIQGSFSNPGGHAGQKGFRFRFAGNGTLPALYLTRPSMPQFSINAEGELIYEEGLAESWNLNADGVLTVTGPKETQYSINIEMLEFSLQP